MLVFFLTILGSTFFFQFNRNQSPLLWCYYNYEYPLFMGRGARTCSLVGVKWPPINWIFPTLEVGFETKSKQKFAPHTISWHAPMHIYT